MGRYNANQTSYSTSGYGDDWYGFSVFSIPGASDVE